jgi:hypothetical protein
MRRNLVWSLTVLAFVVAPTSAAKFPALLSVSDSTTRVGQSITVVLRADRALGAHVTLVAVAPGRAWYDVAGRITGRSTYSNARIPRDGFGIAMARTAVDRWHARLSFPRPGAWQLVVPQTFAEGAGPLAIETLRVRSRIGHG